jgi:hypothetical protein
MFREVRFGRLFPGPGSINKDLIGVTYEVVGAPSKPVVRVNPIRTSAMHRSEIR